MSISRLSLPPQVNTNITLPPQLGAFPDPISPNFVHCSRWYSREDPPQYQDCLSALANLPTGAQPVRYRPLGIQKEPNSLLVMETVGSCQLRFHASGKYVQENPFAINVAPDTIKDMLTYAIDKCVQEKDQGGFVTHLLERATNWIVKPENEFPGEPGHLYLPESITFFTAMVWDSDPFPIGFEPGSNDPAVAENIDDTIFNEYLRVLEQEGDHSQDASELLFKRDFVAEQMDKMRQEQPWRTWWGGESRFGVENGSMAVGNLTGLEAGRLLNLTSNGGEGLSIA